MKWEKPPVCSPQEDLVQALEEGKHVAYLRKADEQYFYWKEVKYKANGPFHDPIKNWGLIKLYRNRKYEHLSFGQYTFNYFVSPFFLERLHYFDQQLMGGLFDNPVLPPDRMEYFKHSLLEEAVASSQVEGAATTTQIAREMLKTGRSPKNESEQMIYNNQKAIDYIGDCIHMDMDKSIIIELHQIMTAKTKAQVYSGDYRGGEVYVTDHIDGEIVHIPPDFSEVEPLMNELCAFINEDKPFIHPIIKASIIHFMIAYIHPFQDGNGRTARALFYWYLLKKGYVLVKNISISRIILESRTQYDKAFLKTESDANDLNYFIFYSLKNIREAFEKLIAYRDKKLENRNKANLIAYELIHQGLNKRQADLVGYLYLKESNKITLSRYSKQHHIVRQTASKDLSQLIKMELIKEDKTHKPYVYTLRSKQAVERFIP